MNNQTGVLLLNIFLHLTIKVRYRNKNDIQIGKERIKCSLSTYITTLYGEKPKYFTLKTTRTNKNEFSILQDIKLGINYRI